MAKMTEYKKTLTPLVVLTREGGRPVAHQSDDDLDFLHEVFEELARAREKYPTANLLGLALMEEVGQLARVLLDDSPETIRRYARQVAAVATRIATEGDESIDDFRELAGLDGYPPERRS
jgi:hypothetical protein